MKELQITLYATLRKYHPEDDGSESFTLEVKDCFTIEDLLEELSIPREESKQIFVNNRRQDMEYLLQEGDRVAIFPPIAGG